MFSKSIVSESEPGDACISDVALLVFLPSLSFCCVPMPVDNDDDDDGVGAWAWTKGRAPKKMGTGQVRLVSFRTRPKRVAKKTALQPQQAERSNFDQTTATFDGKTNEYSFF